MRKYTITSPRFGGFAVLIYSTSGYLMIIDCSQAEMEGQVMADFKKAAPVLEQNVEAQFAGSAGTMVVSDDYVITFDMFWNKYDYKFNRKRS